MKCITDAPQGSIDRREALKTIGLMLGGTLSASTVAGVLGGCRATADAAPPAAPAGAAAALSDTQRETLATLAELILPETDTPGARAAGVPAFVERMLAEWLTEEQRDHFLAGLAEVEARARSEHGLGFLAATPEQQTAILREFAEEAQVADAAAKPSTAVYPDPLAEVKPFFSRLKELVVVGYYTSEVGMTQELQYLPAFDSYQACIPVSAVGRAWVSF